MIKNDTKSVEDIKVIRKIMEESSRFLSLSGLAGLFAGMTAVAGALVAYFAILENGSIKYADYLKSLSEQNAREVRWELLADALIVLIISVMVTLYFSIKKAKKEGKNFMSPISKRLLINFLIPLATGGIFAIVLMIQNNIQLIIPCFLIFYGLALVNAGKFTFSEIFYLGVLELVIGLVSAFIPAWGLIFWILGFGLLHIIYGLAMYRKYEA